MDYLCILNAFEQTYYNRIKEIERAAAAAAAAATTVTHNSNIRGATASNNNIATATVAAASSLFSSSSPTSPSSSSTTSSASSTPTSTAASSPPALLPTVPSALPGNGSASGNRDAVGACAGNGNTAISVFDGLTQHFHRYQKNQSLQQHQQLQLQQHQQLQLQQRRHHSTHSNQQQQQQQECLKPLQPQHHHRHSSHHSECNQQTPRQQQQQLHQANQLQRDQQQQEHNSNVTNSLLWQPWRDFQQAAALHQHFYQQHHHQHHHHHRHKQHQKHLPKESRLTTKELPTAKWRRERRLRAANEYQQQQTGAGVGITIGSSTSSSSPPTTPPPPQHAAVSLQGSTLSHTNTPMTMMMAAAAAAAAMRPLCESTNRPTPPPSLHHSPLGHHGTIAHSLSHESPIDMTVSSSVMKQRSSPPPPYREPLPGTTYATSLARPSVITQAPSKRISVGGDGEVRENLLISNRENDNRSTESISMCETVIDEHFRRSLGADYVALFGAKKSLSTPTTPSPQPPSSSPVLSHMPSMASALAYPAAAHKQQAQQMHHATLQQQQQQQQLISPKPTALLLSPTIIAAQGLAITPLASQSQQQQQQHAQKATRPPPQQQPLALQRRSSTVNVCTKSPSPTPQTYQQPQQPVLVAQRSAHSPTIAVSCTTSATVPVVVGPVHSPSASTAIAYSAAATTAQVRIKTEPDITTTSPSTGTDNMANSFSPPASPTASAYCTTSETPSVDDHFAKALGDTWKQLQAAEKDQRK